MGNGFFDKCDNKVSELPEDKTNDHLTCLNNDMEESNDHPKLTMPYGYENIDIALKNIMRYFN